MEHIILVSIILVVYNGEKYLSECISSILAQSYKNIELIIIDDGSTDKSFEIINHFAQKDTRIRCLKKENEGVSASRNLGLTMAKGEFFSLCDQDDILAKNYIEYFLQLIKKYNCDIAYTPSAYKFKDKINLHSNIKESEYVKDGKFAAIDMLYHNIVIAPWNKLIKTSLIRDNNISFVKGIFNGEGFAFSIACFMASKRVVKGEKYVYYYRVGDPTSGASRFRISSINSMLRAQEIIRKDYLNNDADCLKARNYSKWHTYCDALNIIVGCKAQKADYKLYFDIKKYCREHALKFLKAPVPLNQKLRCILFKISPFLASKIINLFRKRKFIKSND